MNNNDRKMQADRILYEFGLLKRIEEIIMDIKSGLINRGIYSFEQYKSIDVYKAVMENGVKNINEFLALFEDVNR